MTLSTKVRMLSWLALSFHEGSGSAGVVHVGPTALTTRHAQLACDVFSWFLILMDCLPLAQIDCHNRPARLGVHGSARLRASARRHHGLQPSIRVHA